MIVTSSAVSMASNHKATQVSVVEERLVRRDARETQREQAVDAEAAPLPKRVNLSAAGSLLAHHKLNQVLDFSQEIDPKAALNLKILQATLRELIGKDLHIAAPRTEGDKPETALSISLHPPLGQAIRAAQAGAQLVYERTQIYRETESVNFTAQGVVNTADGRSITFDVSLSMAREFTQITHSQTNIFSAGSHALIDPIVINFDGKGAELSLNKIHFDLDMDGTPDQISQLTSGSGYLVWDKNSDGVVNDGSELFGPTTGKGFAELAALDSDGNGFIDEADPIYSQLRVWVQHDNGSSQLFALGEKDVGAIFVGHASTPFNFRDAQGVLLGQSANTGVYLKESGGAGLVQEIYLAK